MNEDNFWNDLALSMAEMFQADYEKQLAQEEAVTEAQQ